MLPFFIVTPIFGIMHDKVTKEEKAAKERRAQLLAEHEEKERKAREAQERAEEEKYNQEHPIVRTITTMVRGSNHYIDEDDFADLYEGEALSIEHCPTDKFPECTNVYVDDFQLIGTIKKDLAEDLVKKLGEGFKIDGEISELTDKGEGEYYRFNILIEIYIRKA